MGVFAVSINAFTRFSIPWRGGLLVLRSDVPGGRLSWDFSLLFVRPY
jgi:hypothetical protein